MSAARIASAELPDTPGSTRLARDFITQTLIGWECDHVREVAELLVSELVTNSVLHARTPIRVSASLTNQRLRVEVWDDSDRMPLTRPYDVDDATGRGLAMVAGFASAWGFEARESGKTVWFEIDT